MKLAITVAAVLAITATAVEAQSTVHVRGYTKSDGTYVAPSERTAPNATKTDNWSSRPNVNPYTGVEGKKDPYAPSTNPSSTSTTPKRGW